MKKNLLKVLSETGGKEGHKSPPPPKKKKNFSTSTNQARPDRTMEMKVDYIRDDRMEFNKNSSNFPFKSDIGFCFYSTGRHTV